MENVDRNPRCVRGKTSIHASGSIILEVFSVEMSVPDTFWPDVLDLTFRPLVPNILYFSEYILIINVIER